MLLGASNLVACLRKIAKTPATTALSTAVLLLLYNAQMLNPFFDDARRGGQRRSHGGGGGGGGNPFEMMNGMMRQMDATFGGDMRASSMMRGDMSMGPSMMMSSMGNGGSSSSYSSSSCCYSSSSSSNGGQPHVVQYSSSSQGVQRPGEEMVQETHRNYRDSTGVEKLGVSRRIGERGRSVVAERAGDGREVRTDNLIGVQDGTAFDQEWRGNSTATAINQARTQQRTAAAPSAIQGGHPTAMLGMASGVGGGMGLLGGPPSMFQEAPRHPEMTNADRRAAREGAARHEADKQRIIAEARAQRGGPSQAPAQLGYHEQQHAAPARGGSRRPDPRDSALASRLAQQEARRAGMY